MSPLGDTNGGAAMFPKDSEQWSQNRTPPGRLCAPPPDLVGTAFPCLRLGPSATKNRTMLLTTAPRPRQAPHLFTCSNSFNPQDHPRESGAPSCPLCR